MATASFLAPLLYGPFRKSSIEISWQQCVAAPVLPHQRATRSGNNSDLGIRLHWIAVDLWHLHTLERFKPQDPNR